MREFSSFFLTHFKRMCVDDNYHKMDTIVSRPPVVCATKPKLKPILLLIISIHFTHTLTLSHTHPRLWATDVVIGDRCKIKTTEYFFRRAAASMCFSCFNYFFPVDFNYHRTSTSQFKMIEKKNRFEHKKYKTN